MYKKPKPGSERLLNINDLGTEEYGQTSNSSWVETYRQTAELLQCIHVLFTDIQNHYQQGHQSAKRSVIDQPQTQTIELPLALTNTQARCIANLLLQEAWGSRIHYEFTLSRKHIFLNPTDLVFLNGKTLRLTSVAYGDPGLIKIKAVSEDTSIYQNVLLPGSTTVFDEANTLLVKLTKGELSSTTEFNVLNGEHLCLVGQELLQFQNAILQPDGNYKLSRFLRGRRNTEWAINTHQISEPFILLNPNSLHRIKSPASDIGLSRIYKAITLGRSVAESMPYSFSHTAMGKKPFSPVHIQGTRKEAGDLTITWIPRTRIQGTWRDRVDTLHDPEIKSYEIDIMKEETIVRTLTNNTETIAYTAEQQIADFGDLQKNLSIRLYAIGRTVRRGFPAIATI